MHKVTSNNQQCDKCTPLLKQKRIKHTQLTLQCYRSNCRIVFNLFLYRSIENIIVMVRNQNGNVCEYDWSYKC